MRVHSPIVSHNAFHMRWGLRIEGLSKAVVPWPVICALSCHAIAGLEDHEPMQPNQDAGLDDAKHEAEEPGTGSLPEVECNHADDDGDGLVDEGLAWRADRWRNLMQEDGLSEVVALRMPDRSVVYFALVKLADDASGVWTGRVDSLGTPQGEVARALDKTRIEGWGIALDAAREELLLAYVAVPEHELRISRFTVDGALVPVGVHVAPLGYPVAKLFDVVWTQHGPVVLVKGGEGYARAEWLDRLDQEDGWNHKLVMIKPDVAKLSVGSAVAWLASGTLDTAQQGILAGIITLDGSAESLPARQVLSAGGGTWPEMHALGSPAIWQDHRVWFTTTDSVRANGTWTVRVSALDPESVASTLVLAGTRTDSFASAPIHGHSLASAFGNILATSVAKDEVRIHRLGPGFEHVTSTDQALVVDDTLAHALVGGAPSPLLFRIRSSTSVLDVTVVGCP